MRVATWIARCDKRRNPIEYILQLVLSSPPCSTHTSAAACSPPTSRNAGVVTAAITEVLAANPDADLFDVEIAFRDGAAHSYLIAGERLSIVFGMQAMLAAVTAAGMTVKQNRAALAGKLLTTT